QGGPLVGDQVEREVGGHRFPETRRHKLHPWPWFDRLTTNGVGKRRRRNSCPLVRSRLSGLTTNGGGKRRRRSGKGHVISPLSGDEAAACSRFAMRPARNAFRPASTASRIASAISTGSFAPAIAVFISTAWQPSSIATAASEAVPTPASTITGTFTASKIMRMLYGLRMPSPDPI